MSNSNQGWSSQAHSQSNLSSRNLDNTLPDLKKYLVDGLRVLDVGCGPGTIILDIALRNRSIYVHGIDADQGMMSSAIANACDLGLQGVHFTRADATALPFADDTFDLVFSNAVIDWIEQPEKVLQEKARVTTPGGSVFTRVSDLASRVAYPTCENSDKVLWAMERMINGSEEYCGWNPFLARRMNHLFRKAGLLDIQITGWTRLSFGGNAPKPNEVLPGWPYNGVFAPIGQRMREAGILDNKVNEKIRVELASWSDAPGAFVMRSGINIAGRVPSE